MTPLESLVACGTKLWLDSVDPAEVETNRRHGARPGRPPTRSSSPTSSRPAASTTTCSGSSAKGRGRRRPRLAADRPAGPQGPGQCSCRSGRRPKGDDGYVSFELDPLLEDPTRNIAGRRADRDVHRAGQEVEAGPQEPHDQGAGHARRARRRWRNWRRRRHAQRHADLLASGSTRSPATPSGAAPSGGRRSTRFKSVYSIFVSRLDVYTEKHVPRLSPAAQGLVGIVNAKRIWRLNQEFWADKKLPLKQEMIFASTGTKKPEDPPWKYVEAFAGSDIETNPPATNDGGPEERPDHYQPGRQICRRRRCWPRSTRRSTCSSWKRR